MNLLRELAWSDPSYFYDKRMREARRQWVQAALDNGKVKREPQWSDSIAVGRPEFLESILNKLHPGHRGRRIVEVNGYYELREEPAAYLANFTPEKDSLNQNKASLLSDS